ncbi:hypothetical protein G7046_g5600 [Stylonectria norvegica]|nr:hypothetical protein G7046_g5600 [Stylonectria norvegica]
MQVVPTGGVARGDDDGGGVVAAGGGSRGNGVGGSNRAHGGGDGDGLGGDVRSGRAVGHLRGTAGDSVDVGGVDGGGGPRGRPGSSVLLGHRAVGGVDSDGLGGDVRTGRAVGHGRGTAGDSVDGGGVDSRQSVAGRGGVEETGVDHANGNGTECEKTLHVDG